LPFFSASAPPMSKRASFAKIAIVTHSGTTLMTVNVMMTLMAISLSATGSSQMPTLETI